MPVYHCSHYFDLTEVAVGNACCITAVKWLVETVYLFMCGGSSMIGESDGASYCEHKKKYMSPTFYTQKTIWHQNFKYLNTDLFNQTDFKT